MAYFDDIPVLDYPQMFDEDGNRIPWDAEGTGIGPLLVAEFFAGCQAPSVATVGLPFETLVASEIDKDASHFISYRNGTPNVGDVRNPQIPEAVLAHSGGREIDSMVGGSPCQPFSQAGHMQGMDDARGGSIIAPWMDHVHVIRPATLIFENVARFRTDGTNPMGHLIGRLIGFVREAVPMDILIADPIIAEIAGKLGDAFAEWADRSRSAAAWLLDPDEFRDRVTENSTFGKTRRRQLKADPGVPTAAKEALGAGDASAFLEAVARMDAQEALASLDAWAAFTLANHEMELPKDQWKRTKASVTKSWPLHGMAYGPAYNIAWRQIDSQYWLPHHRKRIYMFAVRSDLPIDPSDVMFEFD